MQCGVSALSGTFQRCSLTSEVRTKTFIRRERSDSATKQNLKTWDNFWKKANSLPAVLGARNRSSCVFGGTLHMTKTQSPRAEVAPLHWHQIFILPFSLEEEESYVWSSVYRESIEDQRAQISSCFTVCTARLLKSKLVWNRGKYCSGPETVFG